MSVLTKVFVVLLALVSIALSMLVVAAFARQEDWRASANDWRATAAAAQAKERVVAQNAALEQARAQDRHQRDTELTDKLTTQGEEQRRALDDLSRQVAEARNNLTVEQGNTTALAELNKVAVADLNKEREFSSTLAKRNSELERQSIDLNDRVKELTVNVTMAQSQVRALQQQLAAATGRATGEPTAAGATVPTAGTANIVEPNIPSVQPALEAAAPIRGEVLGVKGNLAELSVGSADGVVPGMKFYLYRPAAKAGGKPLYLGALRITKVDAKQAAGLIEQSEGDVRAGDAARDEASFEMRR